MPTAIIADDEAPLRQFLRRQLATAWPELEIVAEAANGGEALDAIDAHRPDIAFLDIRMPVMSGLEVARRAAKPCHIVFVTAHDEYAIQAFEAAALDYLLKPVNAERLARAVERLKSASATPPPDLTDLLAKLSDALRARPGFLQWLQVSQNNELVLLSVEEVDCFFASDKYTLALCADKEWVLRKPLKELETSLDPERFWRIHRNAIVRVAAIARVKNDIRGNHVLELRQGGRTVAVGRSYAHRFRQM
ncbi:MAG: response regulator transcription factor [Betaproteobacteria bacterium]|nr:response regulator transcription factor [Betaproteobacteria bacterium]